MPSSDNGAGPLAGIRVLDLTRALAGPLVVREPAGFTWEDSMMSVDTSSDQIDEQEIARRRDEALRQALNTPPQVTNGSHHLNRSLLSTVFEVR